VAIARRFPKLSKNKLVRIALGLALVFAFLLDAAEWKDIRPLMQLEQWAYDARVRLFLDATRDPRIVIVDIDEKSLNAEGHWPWGRHKLALMVRQLFDKYRVRVVGFDVAFPEDDSSSGLPVLESIAQAELKDNPQYQAFLQQARASLDYDRIFADEIAKRPVILGFMLGAKDQRSGVLPPPAFTVSALSKAEFRHFVAGGYSGNTPLLQASAIAAGHLYPALDPDGVTRSVPMFMRVGDGFYEAMSLAILRIYLGNAPVAFDTTIVGSGDAPQGWIRFIRVGDEVRIPLDYRMTALVPYRDKGAHRYVSATDVLRGNVGADELKDAIAVVGTSAQGLVDLRATPTREDLPGVEVQANLISGALDHTIKYRPPEVLAIAVLTVLLVGVPLALLLPFLSALTATLVFAALFVAMLGANLWAWQARNFVLPIAGPLLMLVALYIVNMVYGYFTETRSRRLITGLFGTYVPKEIVAEMARRPGEYSMRGESREMTVLFSDIRDFTSISESLTPEGLKDLINTYLTRMTLCIQDKRGTIDKYIGDAIMAFWGAPVPDARHARHALECGLEMQKALRTLDPVFAKKGWPALHIGVGINCGRMSVGDMGSQFRRSYTVMGDAVNLASRLEGLTKEYGVGILVSENIVAQVPNYLYREVDKVRVKGKLQGIAIYEPIGRAGKVDAETMEHIERFHEALAQYRQQGWDAAEALLHPLADASPTTKVYKLYLERIAYFRAHPPATDWDGVFVFTTK
jgi:adenylate cyclase